MTNITQYKDELKSLIHLGFTIQVDLQHKTEDTENYDEEMQKNLN